MEELIFILRNLINDVDATTYSDDSLLNLLCTSAFLVISETSFIEGYVVNLQTKAIIPDPTYSNTADIPFMSLTALKAAYLLLYNEAKVHISRSIKIIDGPSTIDLKGQADSSSKLAAERKAEYDQLKKQLKLEYEGGSGLAIMTPTTVETIMYNVWR